MQLNWQVTDKWESKPWDRCKVVHVIKNVSALKDIAVLKIVLKLK